MTPYPVLTTSNTFTATNTFSNGIVSNVTGGCHWELLVGMLKLNSSTAQNISGAQINFTNSGVVTGDLTGNASSNL